jgi:hypothetical protein
MAPHTKAATKAALDFRRVRAREAIVNAHVIKGTVGAILSTAARSQIKRVVLFRGYRRC